MTIINIILEGADGSGKTTAAKYIQMLLEWPIMKGSSFKQATQGNKYLFDKFKTYAKLDRVVFDRFIYSNLVYAELYKDYSILTPEQAGYIEDKIRGNSKVFYLHADLDTVIKRVSERGDDYVKVDMIERIRDKYEEVLDRSSLEIIRIDTTNKKPLEVAQEVLSHAGFAAYS